MKMEAYKNPNTPIEYRVRDLIGRMSLKEKIGQMTMTGKGSLTPTALRDGSVGGLNAGRGPYDSAPIKDWADKADEWQQAALQSRLGIPLILGVDAIHGHNNAYGTTIFPHNMGLGATRDAELIQRIGAATALEARAGGINYAFAPCVAVVKDLRWNRCYESYSEDPEIVGRMASIITGLQGLPPAEHPKGHPFVTGRNNMIACAKHFVGDGGTEGGKNEGNTRTSYDELETVHMAPYLDCISQHVCTVMASYSSYNGHNMHSHKLLLTDVLKNKLGFKGFVISDWGGIDRLKDNGDPEGAEYRVCAALGINAGIDMVLGPLDLVKFQEDLISLVEAGEVPISRIDDAVERILKVKFAAGIFEHPFSDRSLLDLVGCKLHREIAREAVRKSLVLLKNGKDPEKPLLPLDKNARKILVAGSHADDLGYQCGAWTVSWTGGSGRTTIGTTILDAIKRTVGPETEVIFEQCPSADTLSAHDFAFAVVAVGEPPYAEYICSKTKLVIPSDLADMICSVADRVPTLLVLITGRPIELKPEMLEKIDALVAAWLPGTEGNGITDVVFGDYDFVGRLPVSWFKTLDQLPMDPSANLYDPLFPVGFGLTHSPKIKTNSI
ncbi:uncharacterized protein LOC116187211 isoform X1 [Punica granatum]|uniref:Uncharacterized protein LOC116187211 isoform X1 n=2 Tax=Punica granatum TaxID=22663 RepID=A0A6P8BN41_PUNGR|nr:uncharacterized protein LOC116187211 isoform X1 [Punica granatum]